MGQRNRGEMTKLVKDLRKQGFDVERSGSGHWKVTKPGEEGATFLSFSPGAGGLKQSVAQLRKLGYDDTPKQKGKHKK